MQPRNAPFELADLVDGTVDPAIADAWLAAHPEAAEEVAIARRVRALVAELRAAQPALPPDFERRLLARVQADHTLLDVLNLSLVGTVHVLLDLLNAIFFLVPTAGNTRPMPFA